MKYILTFCFIHLLVLGWSKTNDSLTVKTINGKRFIVHRVDAGQTAMAVTRIYSITLSEFIKHNPHIKPDKLKKGELVYIPVSDSLISAATAQTSVDRLNTHANADAEKTAVVTRHTVQAGETLAKITQKYKISQPEITRWNSLRDGKIEAGQVLIVNETAARSPYKAWNKPGQPMSEELIKISTERVSEQYLNIKVIEGNSVMLNKLPHPAFVVLEFVEDSVNKLVELHQANVSLPENTIAIGKELLQKWGIRYYDQRVLLKRTE